MELNRFKLTEIGCLNQTILMKIII